MRGKGKEVEAHGQQSGITPAHAGKRRARRKVQPRGKDHPRPCGEKYGVGLNQRAGLGSPPPMRGKAKHLKQNANHLRITPAHAGKSSCRYCSRPRTKDHPRPCGEKTMPAQSKTRGAGSPPPMRGKGRPLCRPPQPDGITPAHAGKSDPCYSDRGGNGDHPRPCGEKLHLVWALVTVVGSPPPMRGKGLAFWHGVPLLRITPAHAGKRLRR